MSGKDSNEYVQRMKEITAVLHRHKLTAGMNPEKLRQILADLGPTYVKLGQIASMRSDILPSRYCLELMKLRSSVNPLEFGEVRQMLTDSYGCPPEEIFASVEETPLGAASIAQVHRAVLRSGEDVVVKVQRPGIYEMMARDIGLLHRAVRLVPPVSIKESVDLNMVLDEMWTVAQEEMNFLKEASNMEEFAANSKEIAYACCPKLYREYSTNQVLVMEYVDGFEIDDKEALNEAGYDLDEIGKKLVNHYMQQILEDGFFQADPHPGNLRIRDGKIVWMDMGMMGRLSARDKEQISEAVLGLAQSDAGRIMDAVTTLGEFRGEPDHARLYKDITELMKRYGKMELGEIDLAKVMEDLLEIMKANRISMPHGLTMLARGLSTMEGVLMEISPDINMVEIAAARMNEQWLQDFDWKKSVLKEGRRLHEALHKTVDIPILAADILQEYRRGETRINLDLHASDDLARMMNTLVKNLVIGFLITALLVSSSILCLTDMKPRMLGIPMLGIVGYIAALILMIFVLLRHVKKRKR
ncbi:ABC1 kinase family protein [Hespellia stercorisuis]|uniref:Ubiquinone biosynthesis protein n=1 Tax=Hespellia stercorisuis DSM 15480 TaxID=1121950 RepID=A0A1M6L9V4_9FIRM|nr:AarF/UbiB family protein [Hespellia stercorisuis]SHJ67991.1 ubiquinone biosynthesis protein [Hespellia stercorisuis DSM 15480]